MFKDNKKIGFYEVLWSVEKESSELLKVEGPGKIYIFETAENDGSESCEYERYIDALEMGWIFSLRGS